MGRITNDLNDIGELAHHGPENVFIAVMTFYHRSTDGLARYLLRQKNDFNVQKPVRRGG
jgi:hypothetical protein